MGNILRRRYVLFARELPSIGKELAQLGKKAVDDVAEEAIEKTVKKEAAEEMAESTAKKEMSDTTEDLSQKIIDERDSLEGSKRVEIGSETKNISEETELFLTDKFYEKNLPSQVSPGIKYLPKYDEFGNVKQIKMYDDFGREKGWVDYTNHRYGDINSPYYHTAPHWHERIYDAQNRDGMKVNHRTDTNTPLGRK